MKNTIFICLLMMISSASFSQVEKNIMDQLKSGDYSILTEKMDSRLDLCIKDDQQFLPKSEALKLIKSFNEQNAISSYKLIHSGSSKGNNSKYSVVEVNSSSPYRLMLFFDGDKISEIRFE